MEGLGGRVSFEHQARIIGMGLLLGEIPFAALVTGWNASRARGEEPDLDTLLADLERQGILGEEARTSLQAQVAELERLIQEPSPAGDSDPTTEYSGTNLTAVASVSGTEEASRQTPSWTRQSHTRPRNELGRNLLSVLTLPNWNQFINLRFVGEGGMGRIFRAFDPTLNRSVALKFLRWVNHDGISDLVREARNQAQVDHPNICKVYEVKEWQGQVYVVMQFIDGQTLDRVAPLMDLPQKVELMEKVADAVHAAHRKGLIHRDLKPNNIMVEQTHDGAYVPFVLDFGLARDTERNNETRQGTIQGTAHYMAPEQARGDTDLIERRTDVYALGVTLYELFTGAPPFSEIPGMDCLRYILEADIPPLRTRNPNLPSDLQTIVMKCLEKEISQRYESARALGEDLRRFRDGEPILARPSSLGYRLGKFARKYKMFVILGTLALLTVLVFAGMVLQARFTAASQARWAQHYGQEAERIEALLRYVRLQPLHDIRGELTTVGQRIQAIETELRGARTLASGPGNYALGRAYLALGDAQRAQQHLDRAWEAGFRVPDVAYARGRALGQIYAHALDSARAIQDVRLRQARLQELEETLRAPAVTLLREGQGSLLDPPSFQEALLARYDRHYEESLRLAKSALSEAPWFYEARRLEAEIHLEQARLEQEPARILMFLDQSGTALEAASSTAPSDPSLWDLLSRRWWEEMIVRRRAGQSLQKTQVKLQEACAKWQKLLPDSPDPEARLARGELEVARVPGVQPETPGNPGPLARALNRTEALLARNPKNPELLGALASGLQLRAYQNFNRGGDPRPDLDRASTLLRRAFDEDPSAIELLEPFVASHWARVEFEKAQGRDPTAPVQEALKAIQTLAKGFPKMPDFNGFLGGLQVELADYLATHGINPEEVVRQALVHLDQASKMAPSRFEFHFSRGNAHLASAQFRVLRNQDAQESLTAAEAAYRAALACNASAEGALLGLGEVALLRSQALERLRRSPLSVLSQAEEILVPLQTQRGNWRVVLFAAQIDRFRALWTPPSPHTKALLAQAEKATDRALMLSGRTPPTLLAQAQVQVAWAALFTSEARFRKVRARQLLGELLAKDPTYEAARQLLATLD